MQQDINKSWPQISSQLYYNDGKPKDMIDVIRRRTEWLKSNYPTQFAISQSIQRERRKEDQEEQDRKLNLQLAREKLRELRMSNSRLAGGQG